MTGAFLRVERGGKWESVEVEYLTEKEIHLLFDDGRDKEELVRWIILLANTLRPVAIALDI